MTPYQDNSRPYAPIMIAVRELEALRKSRKEPITVLDVGCSKGYMAARLKKRGHYRVDGIEKDEDDAEAARRHCDHLYQINLNHPEDVLAATANTFYDAILFMDVLEHLSDPSTTLAALVSRLAPGGRVIVSLPNIAHASIRLALLLGRFQYRNTGILDKTHLHFYTKHSACALVESAGLQIYRLGFGSNRFGRLLRYLPSCGGWLGFNLIVFARNSEQSE